LFGAGRARAILAFASAEAFFGVQTARASGPPAGMATPASAVEPLSSTTPALSPAVAASFAFAALPERLRSASAMVRIAAASDPPPPRRRRQAIPCGPTLTNGASRLLLAAARPACGSDASAGSAVALGGYTRAKSPPGPNWHSG